MLLPDRNPRPARRAKRPRRPSTAVGAGSYAPPPSAAYLFESAPPQASRVPIDVAVTDLTWMQRNFGVEGNENVVTVDNAGRIAGSLNTHSPDNRALGWVVNPMESVDHYATNLEPSWSAGTNTSKNCSPAIRLSVSGGQINGYSARWGNTGNAQILRIDNGVLTLLNSLSSPGVPEWYRLEAEGSTIRLIDHTGVRVSAVDSTHTGLLVGIMSYSGQGYCSSWEAGVL